MLRKTEYGKWIISASEVSEFMLCPEAWRLKSIEGVRRADAARVSEGSAKHTRWAKRYDEASELWRMIRLVVWLILVATAGLLLRHGLSP